MQAPTCVATARCNRRRAEEAPREPAASAPWPRPALPLPPSIPRPLLCALSTAVLALGGAAPPAQARRVRLSPPARAEPRPQAAPLPVDLGDGSGTALAYHFNVPLRIVALRPSVPAAWLPAFRRSQGRGARVHFSARGQLGDIFRELSGGGREGAAGADAVSLGDAWLAPAVAAGLLAPVPVAAAARWRARLPAAWEALCTRLPGDGSLAPAAAGGRLYGVPYRWGATLLALRTARPEAAGLSDWSGLCDPQLAGRLALPAAPRELLAIALLSLGVRPNTLRLRDLPAAAGAEALLERLRLLARRQARLLDTGDGSALKALAAGDVWAAAGEASEVLAFARRTPGIRVIAPASGTLLWADVWVLPAARAADASPLLGQWYDFTTSPARAAPAAGLRGGAAPGLLPPPPAQPPPPPCAADCELVGGCMPSAAVLARSSFLAPLPPDGAAEFGALLRRAGVTMA